MDRLERAFRAYLRGHEVAAAATSEKELWDTLCQVAVEELGYRLAWVGLKSEEGPVTPVAQAGFEDGYLSSIQVTWSEGDLGQGPTGTAIRSAHTSVAQDIASDPRFAPWREDALARGYRSSAAIPLLHGTEAIGAFNLYAPEADAFEPREVAFLESLAATLTAHVLQLRMGKELESLNQALDQAARAQTASAVTAAVAHDLNNLLCAASMSVELARWETKPSKESAKLLDEAKNALGSASKLTGQLMALWRKERNGDDSEVDLVLSQLHPLLARLAHQTHLELRPKASGACAPISALALERITINLVLNAAHAADGGGHIEVETRIQPTADAPAELACAPPASGSYVVLSVQDDGPGIAKDVLHRLFDPYVTTKDEGTGLGLSSVRALAREAGGDVTVDSSEGSGARFEVWLPQVESLAAG
jgi:signal transduction histidine kinase